LKGEKYMASKNVAFSTANDLYNFNKEATKCKTDVRVKTKSGSFNFDAKTLLGLFFVLNLSGVEVLYDEEEREFDQYLTSLEVA
jgi:hypothetical protein